MIYKEKKNLFARLQVYGFFFFVFICSWCCRTTTYSREFETPRYQIAMVNKRAECLENAEGPLLAILPQQKPLYRNDSPIIQYNCLQQAKDDYGEPIKNDLGEPQFVWTNVDINSTQPISAFAQKSMRSKKIFIQKAEQRVHQVINWIGPPYVAYKFGKFVCDEFRLFWPILPTPISNTIHENIDHKLEEMHASVTYAADRYNSEIKGNCTYSTHIRQSLIRFINSPPHRKIVKQKIQRISQNSNYYSYYMSEFFKDPSSFVYQLNQSPQELIVQNNFRMCLTDLYRQCLSGGITRTLSEGRFRENLFLTTERFGFAQDQESDPSLFDSLFGKVLFNCWSACWEMVENR